jgi:hypothetical protein
MAVPDQWLVLGVHGDVMLHGCVVGKREIEKHLSRKSLEAYCTSDNGRQIMIGRVGGGDG